MNTKVLVTGASGFIGGHIVRRLASLGIFEVHGLSRSEFAKLENFPVQMARYIQADLSALGERTFDAEICVHVAGLADDRATWPMYLRHNVRATESLLNALPHCRLFVFISSSSVYDFSDGQPKREEDSKLTAKLSMYGRSKLMAERLIEERSTISTRYILRPRAVYGSGDRVLLPRIKQLIWRGLLILPGDLRILSSLTSINLLVDVVENLLNDCTPSVHTFNIADPQAYLLRQKLEELGAELSGKPLHVVVLPMTLLKVLAKILQFLRIPSNLSPQALNYLSQNSVLKTSKYQQRSTMRPLQG